ncbi:MAG: hypothetical protein D6797_03170 [Bdellovibrio sp.]|nr:MAG: hypothetical protein D6797_03170 [Bdellovibrio sp.]
MCHTLFLASRWVLGIFILSLLLSPALANIAIGLLFLILIFSKKACSFSAQKISPLGPDLYLWLFWGWMFISLAINGELSTHYKTALFYGRFVLILYVLHEALLLHKDWILSKAKIFYNLMGAIALYAIFQSLTRWSLENFHWVKLPLPDEGFLIRSYGFLGNTMSYSFTFAMFFSVFLALFTCFATTTPNKTFKKIWNFWPLFAVLLSLLFALTRSVWLGVTLSLLIVLTFYRDKKLITSLLALGLFLVSINIFLPQFNWRWKKLTAPKATSRDTRIDLLKAHSYVFLHAPLWGKGLRTQYDEVSQYYKKFGSYNHKTGHAHNNFLEIASGLGLVGLTLFIIIFGFFLWDNWKALIAASNPFTKSWLVGIFAAQAGFHLASFFDTTFYDFRRMHALLFLIALYLVLKKKPSAPPFFLKKSL